MMELVAPASSVLPTRKQCSEGHSYKQSGSPEKASGFDRFSRKKRCFVRETDLLWCVGVLEMLWSMGGPTHTITRQDAQRSRASSLCEGYLRD